MATTRPYAINTGSTIDGTQQIGYIAIATGSTLPDGPRWWMGPDEDTGYVITVSDLTMSQSTPAGINAGLRFWRSAALTDESFLGIANVVARRLGASIFASTSEATAWLSLSGYSTTYSGVSPPAVLEDGNNFGWWDYTDTATITKDGSNYVSAWADKIGTGATLSQGTGSLQPLYTSDGIETDGLTQFLSTGTVSLSQPLTLYMVIKFPTYAGSWRYLSSGVADTLGVMLYYDKTNGVNYRLYAGNAYGNACFCPFNKDFVTTAMFSGGSSYITFNEGSTGTGGGTILSSPNGFQLGHRTSSYCNLRAKEIIIRRGMDSTETVGQIYSYLFNKHIAPEIEYDVLYDGYTSYWYDYTQTSSLTLTGTTGVTIWESVAEVRAATQDLTQTTSGLTPELTSNGVYCDGDNDTMSATIANIVQPYTIYLVIKQHSYTHLDRIIGGASNTGLIYQYGTSPNIRFNDPYSGLYIDTTGLTIGSFGVLCVIGDGTNSLIQVNNGTPVTASGNLSGQIINPLTITGVSTANVEFKEIIIRECSDDSDKRTEIYNYLVNKHSL